MSLDIGIYSDLSSVSLYSSQIILYKSLHVCWKSILESTIWEILYLVSLLIITSVEASCILLGKELDVVGLSIDIWETGWTEHIESERQRVNNSILGQKIIL